MLDSGMVGGGQTSICFDSCLLHCYRFMCTVSISFTQQL